MVPTRSRRRLLGAGRHENGKGSEKEKNATLAWTCHGDDTSAAQGLAKTVTFDSTLPPARSGHEESYIEVSGDLFGGSENRKRRDKYLIVEGIMESAAKIEMHTML